MPKKLIYLSADAIEGVNDAAVAIASSLISKKLSVEVFLQAIPRAISYTRIISYFTTGFISC